MLKSVLGALMTYCVENSKQFKDNIELFEEKTFKEAMSRIVHKSHDGDYVIRLFLKQRWGAGGVTSASPGEQNQPTGGYALLRLNERLPKPERLHLRETLRDCLNKEGVVSPIVIKQWLIPGNDTSLMSIQTHNCQLEHESR